METKPQRTKIIATLGPATSSREAIERLARAGVDVFRLNFSHGEAADHERSTRLVREVSRDVGRHIAILQDLQGIKVRTAPSLGGPFELVTGSEILVEPGSGSSGPERVFVGPAAAFGELAPGNRLLMDDGRIHLVVRAREGNAWRCAIESGGLLRDRKGVNLPDTPTPGLPALTPKDLRDLEVGVRLGVDLVALSFVRTAEDVRQTRQALAALGADTPVIAKIEKPEAIDDLRNILRESFGVMVARGDLGVELSPEKVPVAQKRIIAEARRFRRPVITATQMLESMIESPTPTRAEASDVANAVFDGTDAVMLSGETAVGRYPVEAVRMMARIVDEAEAEILQRHTSPVFSPAPLSVAEATGKAATIAAESVGARAIVVYTQGGSTALLISADRPTVPIFVLGSDERVLRRLALAWGVECCVCECTPTSIDEVIAIADRCLLQSERVPPESAVVMVAGYPFGEGGPTNLLQVHRFG